MVTLGRARHNLQIQLFAPEALLSLSVISGISRQANGPRCVNRRSNELATRGRSLKEVYYLFRFMSFSANISSFWGIVGANFE
jgi:hypothetical protein